VCEQAVHLHLAQVDHGQVLQQTPTRALVLQPHNREQQQQEQQR
jgi:hypothetical protein